MMKIWLTTLLVVICFANIFSQTDIYIGANDGNNNNKVVNGYYNYSKFQYIYHPEEIGNSGDIVKIAFNVAGWTYDNSTGILENLTDGGEVGNPGLIHSEETKKILSQKSSKPRSMESRKKQSISVSGDKNHFYGKTHTEKTKEKMRKPKTNLSGYTDEVLKHRSKLNSNSMKERWRKYKIGEGPHPIKGTYLTSSKYFYHTM